MLLRFLFISDIIFLQIINTDEALNAETHVGMVRLLMQFTFCPSSFFLLVKVEGCLELSARSLD